MHSACITALALDPGETTGCSLGSIDTGGFRVERTWQARYTTADLHAMLNCLLPDFLITESFEYRNRSQAGLSLFPRNLIGVMDCWSLENSVRFTQQTAAMGKTYFTKDKLLARGVYVRGIPHGMDALRHLLVWANFHEGAKYIERYTYMKEAVRGG